MREKKHLIVQGLVHGDEGKGTAVDYLVKKYGIKRVVRYNGAPQAAHFVVLSDGRKHCFSQFGSGTLVSGVKTYLSRFMLINPLAIEKENSALEEIGITDALRRLEIDQRCLIITPFQKHLNRMREIARGENRYGSCGLGVGETVRDAEKLGIKALTASNLTEWSVLKRKLYLLWCLKVEEAQILVDQDPNNERLVQILKRLKRPDYVDVLTDRYYQFGMQSGALICNEEILFSELRSFPVIFEGAQGALLDVNFGFWPHVTHSNTTSKNALTLLENAKNEMPVERIGVLRAYATRHGAGPFVTEDASLIGKIKDENNVTNDWQGSFRLGHLDLVGLKYALAITGGVDSLFVTCLDQLQKLSEIKICTGYVCFERRSAETEKFFVYDGEDQYHITQIKVARDASFEERTKLTELLKKCQPLYLEMTDAARQEIEFLSFLEKETNVPLRTLSYGPTSANKIEYPVIGGSNPA